MYIKIVPEHSEGFKYYLSPCFPLECLKKPFPPLFCKVILDGNQLQMLRHMTSNEVNFHL